MRRLTASERLARILGMIPWVVARDGALIEEIVARFDYPRPQLIADLTKVLFFVGIHPYTPDTLIDVDIIDEHVQIRYADWFSKPLRLSVDEATRLLVAGRSLLALTPGTDDPDTGAEPLLRALAKLELILGDGDGPSVEVRLDDAPEEALALLGRAVRNRLRVEIEYYSYNRNELTLRAVDPAGVFSDNGYWYLSGWCYRARAERVFRVDRIRKVTLTETEVEADLPDPVVPVFEADADHPLVTIRLTDSARWVAEQYPVRDHEELDDGRLEVKLAVSSNTWLARLLVRLGPHAEVVDRNPHIPSDLAASTAARILRRYRSDEDLQYCG